jgi:hypothetical protein
VQKNSSHFSSNDPECIPDKLVNKGVCPFDVTTDQLKIILKDAKMIKKRCGSSEPVDLDHY